MPKRQPLLQHKNCHAAYFHCIRNQCAVPAGCSLILLCTQALGFNRGLGPGWLRRCEAAGGDSTLSLETKCETVHHTVMSNRQLHRQDRQSESPPKRQLEGIAMYRSFSA
jgi:hypothetical protein